ncbi:ABC transporter substrate-binding protein [Streptomyces sp. SID4985]|uniref:ABC transporter substrate-binding protein n=1 Tax=Streptomyces sp. SID4985 TaxID=2690292 RepID=UPI001369384D|nr:ABC transporter substrate-binding protein [Streptomyces sp. SID4985]MYQ44613.1 ABC transporter substrate-binding protein [Streptomyces sp. SID4985]
MTGRRLPRGFFRFPLPPRTRTTARYAGSLAVCASLLAGCGVMSGSDSGDDTVKVMTWAPENTKATNKPGMPAMAAAYAKWINSRGGIGGRKLQVLTCNERNDSVAVARCARRAADEGVVAVVGSYSQYGDSYLAPLEGAGIPYIGGYGVTSDELTSPVSYPVNGGQPALLAGLGRALAADCGPVTLVRPDSIAGDEMPPLFDAGLKAGGHPEATDQLAADDATEYSSASDRALRGATAEPGNKGCVVPALGDRTNNFMDSFRRARTEFPGVRTATVLGSVDQSLINATGGADGPYEGAYVTSWYPVASDPRWNSMKKIIDTEAFGDNRIDPADAGVQTTYLAYTVLKAALERIGTGEVSADTVQHTLDHGLRVGTGGLTPTLHWPDETPLAAVGFPRLANADVTVQVVRGGKLVAAKQDAAGASTVTDTTSTLEKLDEGRL